LPGVDGMMFAYRFHAARWLNGESTWDAIAYHVFVNLRKKHRE